MPPGLQLAVTYPPHHVASALLTCTLLAAFVGSRSGQAAPARPLELKLTGPGQLPERFARAAAGRLPATGSSSQALAAWCKAASGRIVAAYRGRGYSYARAWHRVAPDGRRVWIHLDEGRMLPVFVGAGTVRAIFYRVDLHLPGSVFHRPTLRRALRELRDKYRLANVYHRVTDAETLVRTPLETLVPQRRLHIYVISRDARGFALKVSLSTSWGILPTVAYRRRGLLFKEDRFSGSVQVAVPYRRFFFEQDPEFQWVHSAARFSYRVPPFFGKHFAPQLGNHTAVSRFARSDPDLQSYFRFHVEGLLGVALLFEPLLTLELSGGPTYTRVFDIDQGATPQSPLPDQLAVRRTVAQVEAKLDFDRHLRRRDQRNQLTLRLRGGISSDDEKILDVRWWGQLVAHLGQHDLLIRSRGIFLAGEVPFWDEENLAGGYLRTFFDNRYWVHEAIQLSVAFRYAFSYVVKVGLFHDLALFFDRSRDDQPLAIANSFGPGLHLLLFDLLSLDLFYGFGFAEVGFDHSFSFKLRTAF